MSLLYPITAEMKQKPHPQTSTFTPNSGNLSREQQNRAQVGGTEQGQPGASGAQGPGFCYPLFWDCPMQSRELDLILVVLSNSGYSRIAPGLPSPCSQWLWELLLRAGSGAQCGNSQDPLLWTGASSCHSGQRDEAGLGLPLLIQEGYPHVRPSARLLTELC